MIQKENIDFTTSSWESFLSSITEGSNSQSVKAFMQIESDLHKLGINDNLISAVKDGFKSDNWTKAISAFSQTIDDEYIFYAGPMTPNERYAPTLGFILLQKNPIATEIHALLDTYKSEIGNRFFGFPCDFGDRYVELYDVMISAGSMKKSRPAIALFTPFYQGGWQDLPQNSVQRRTILFHNVVKNRFIHKTYPKASNYLRSNGNAFHIPIDNDAIMNSAIGLWLILHELMHSSGPLPLFGSKISKLSLGQTYGSIEEARVDMSVWTTLNLCQDIFGEAGNITTYIILMERLFRSAQLASVHKEKAIGAEGEHALFWLNLISKGQAEAFNQDGTINLNPETLKSSIVNFLGKIYSSEQEAITKTDNGPTILMKLAETLREEFLSPQDHSFTTTQEWIQKTA